MGLASAPSRLPGVGMENERLFFLFGRLELTFQAESEGPDGFEVARGFSTGPRPDRSAPVASTIESSRELR
jgi:hypothetical protein